jgi:hypothetical protein
MQRKSVQGALEFAPVVGYGLHLSGCSESRSTLQNQPGRKFDEKMALRYL